MGKVPHTRKGVSLISNEFDAFFSEIRRQRDVKTFIVTIENRGALPAQLAAMLLGATD